MIKVQNLVSYLILGCLAGALYTYTLPLVQAKVPPVVTERWSAWDMTKPLTKAFTKKESKTDIVKVDFDFMDVLVKILPQNEETGSRKKISLTFVAGLLVPVAMIAAYLLTAVSLLLFLVGATRLFTLPSLGSVGASVYALAGTFYLGQAAQRAFQQTVDRHAEGVLGAIAKHIVREITIAPDTALYALAACTAAAFLLSRFRKGIAQ